MTRVTQDPGQWSFASPLPRAPRGWLPTPSCTCSRRGPWRAHRRGRGWAWVTRRVAGQSLKVCRTELPEPSPLSLASPCPAAPCHPIISWGVPGGARTVLGAWVPMGGERAGRSCGARVLTSPWQWALPLALVGHTFTGSLWDFTRCPRGAGSMDGGRGGGLGSTRFAGLRLVEELLGLCGQVPDA